MSFKTLSGFLMTAGLVCAMNSALAETDTDSLMLHISNLSGRTVSYMTTLSPEEKALHSSPLEGTIAAKKAMDVKNYAGMFIFRDDHKDFVADLKITDPEVDGRVIWEGKIVGDAGTHAVRTVVSKADETHYKLHIMLSKAGEPMPSFSIGITSKE